MTNICTWLWASHKRWDCLFACFSYNLSVKIKVLQNSCTSYWRLLFTLLVQWLCHLKPVLQINLWGWIPQILHPLPLKLVPPHRPQITLELLWWKEPAGFPWKNLKTRVPDPAEDEDCRGWDLVIPDFILTLPTNVKRTTFWEEKKCLHVGNDKILW